MHEYLVGFTDEAAALTAWFSQQGLCVAVLETLRVCDECQRGRGHGRSLLTAFIDRAAQDHAQAILLVADFSEEQRKGFVLEDWYARHGFISLPGGQGGAVMVYPSAIGLTLREHLLQTVFA